VLLHSRCKPRYTARISGTVRLRIAGMTGCFARETVSKLHKSCERTMRLRAQVTVAAGLIVSTLLLRRWTSEHTIKLELAVEAHCSELPTLDAQQQCCLLADYNLIASAERQSLSAALTLAPTLTDPTFMNVTARCLWARQQLNVGQCSGIDYNYDKTRCTQGPYLAHQRVLPLLPQSTPPAQLVKVSSTFPF
jgi:hypothetical protein